MRRLSLILVLAAAPALSQCVMCFRTAAAQQSERARVLNSGIFVLGIPPLAILSGFAALAWRRRGKFSGSDGEEASHR